MFWVKASPGIHVEKMKQRSGRFSPEKLAEGAPGAALLGGNYSKVRRLSGRVLVSAALAQLQFRYAKANWKPRLSLP